jgi:hypothetical protein
MPSFFLFHVFSLCRNCNYYYIRLSRVARLKKKEKKHEKYFIFVKNTRFNEITLSYGGQREGKKSSGER